MKKITIGLAGLAAAFILAGCAGPKQANVDLAPTTFSSQAERVGVAMTALPKVDTHLPGAGCLLCIAAASIANNSLIEHTKTLPYEDLPKLKNELADVLRKKGLAVEVINEDIDLKELPDFSGSGSVQNLARKDFTTLKGKYNIDKLLVINLSKLGMERPYASYVPTSDPKAVLQGTGYMVNLKTNVYEWYLPVEIMKSSDGKWDEPPKFPGLTNAYFQAVEQGKDSFLQPFAQK